MCHAFKLTIIGDNCGANYLNDRFEELLKVRLSEEDYLGDSRRPVVEIARHAVPVFENLHKREVDISRRPTRDIHVPGLKGDETRGRNGVDAKHFADNFLLLDV